VARKLTYSLVSTFKMRSYITFTARWQVAHLPTLHTTLFWILPFRCWCFHSFAHSVHHEKHHSPPWSSIASQRYGPKLHIFQQHHHQFQHRRTSVFWKCRAGCMGRCLCQSHYSRGTAHERGESYHHHWWICQFGQLDRLGV
jgi:hypothetical protein